MARPTALESAKQQLAQCLIADIRRGPNGSLVVSDDIESPAVVRPGRYYLLDGPEMKLLVARLAAVEATQLLAKALKKGSGRKSSRRLK